MMWLEAEEIMQIRVKCSEPLAVGDGGAGHLNVIPITGGSVTGKYRGVVIAGGADWSTIKSNGAHAFAKYLLQMENGEYVAVENEGILNQDTAKIRTSPRFYADVKGDYSELNKGVYVASLETEAGEYKVNIHVYKMR
ncbi:hypothetical protein CS063_13175 [Sporanaerobium hydrogeniformans]|uniref:Uncharacterized protein n=1 Tax=Sporanaerobium hydrogeniformans TaxID=3072179 RepID=A0AC61D9K1_9FIRM|nr:DUF3237 domain-containing protein [Sporanaerobium hydrogeniformans]PHV69929.1 hypothetical protein CS063_13175 [Sporanaerobium hydrogeniformans]